MMPVALKLGAELSNIVGQLLKNNTIVHGQYKKFR